MNQEGSKKARAELKKFHYCLNSPSLLPAQTYTPNSVACSPVIQVNQIVALMFSHNYERVPFLIKLAYTHFDRLDGLPVYDSYRVIAFDYLCQVAYFLEKYTEIEHEYLIKMIPSDILSEGSKNAPNYDVESNKFDNL